MYCSRCGRDSHTVANCYAVKHADGHWLTKKRWLCSHDYEDDEEVDEVDEVDEEVDDWRTKRGRCVYDYESEDEDDEEVDEDDEEEGDFSCSDDDDGRCARCGRDSHMATQCYARTHADGQPLASPAVPESPEPSSGQGPGVYALELASGSVYVGKASNVQKRIRDHFQGNGAALTREDPPIGSVPLLDGKDEMRETLAQMAVRGLSAVRGYRWIQKNLRPEDQRAIVEEMIEQYDLCRKCGRRGHFAPGCTLKVRVLSQTARLANATQSVARICADRSRE